MKMILYYANRGVFHNIVKKNGMYVVETYVYKDGRQTLETWCNT